MVASLSSYPSERNQGKESNVLPCKKRNNRRHQSKKGDLKPVLNGSGLETGTKTRTMLKNK
jgi:hypothetical protein